MSLLVLIWDAQGVCLAADTRASYTAGGHAVRPEPKLFVRKRNGAAVLVGLGGTRDISGKPVLDYVDDGLSSPLNQWLQSICDTLKRKWATDVKADRWTAKELRNYKQTGSLRLFMITSPQPPFAMIEGDWKSLSVKHFTVPPVAVGVDMINSFCNANPVPPRAMWTTYLSNFFSAASQVSPAVAFPVDVARWDVGSRMPVVLRYDSERELSAATLL